MAIAISFFLIHFLLLSPPIFADQHSCLSEDFRDGFTTSSKTEKYSYFVPPKNWLITHPKFFAPSVQFGVVGKNKKGFVPSINLAIEEVQVSLNEYIKTIKKLHEADRDNRWRDLGSIQTKAGPARVTEIDTKTEWGAVRLLQSIMIKDGFAYILTAAALKEEFSEFYDQFEKVFKSFTITTNLFDCIPKSKKKEKLQAKLKKLKQGWLFNENHISEAQARFSDKHFQKNHWIPFQKFLMSDFNDMGAHWQTLMAQRVSDELFSQI